MTKTCRGRVRDQDWGAFRALHNAGWPKRKIAGKYNVACRTVSRWLNSDTPPSVACTRTLSQETVAHIASRRRRVKRLIEQTVDSVRQKFSPIRKARTVRVVKMRAYPSAAAVARALGDTSSKTVVRDLKEMGYKQFSQPSGPHLTPQHKKQRVDFCKWMLDNPEVMRLLMFSDEKWFDSQTKRKVKMWATDCTGLPTRFTDQGAARLLVLGFISKTHKRLLVLDEDKMDTELYRKQLLKVKEMLQSHIFMQDNARPHVALAAKGFFKNNRINLLDYWPPYSPDLNMIETLWARLSKVVKDRAPFGVQELRQFVIAEFEAISQAEIAKLCDEFKERLQVCLQEKGGLVTSTLLRQFRAKKAAKRGRK